MGRIDELTSAEFATWEQRARGWRVWPHAVRPEPPFEEFLGYRLAAAPQPDDSRRPGLFASFFDSVERNLKPPQPPLIEEEIIEPEPDAAEQALTSEFVASLPASLKIGDEAVHAFLDSLAVCAEPVCFELFGNHERVGVQIAASPGDAISVERQVRAFFPEITFSPTQCCVQETWNNNAGEGFVVDFGLAHEVMLPLNTRHQVDPFVGIIGALNELRADELALFQVLFQPVQNAWAASLWRSVTGADGKGLFVNRPHLIPGTKEKVEAPFFGVVLRAAAKAKDFDRAALLVRDIAFALRPFTRIDNNRLIPLTNDEYPFEAHEEDLLQRLSRRSGMLLNRDELLGFVHFPSDDVRSQKLERQRTRTKAAPALATSGVLLGHNRHAGRSLPVRLSAERRVRHTHIVGASGTGKSTLLFNFIQQDIQNGEGVAVLDPHGDLVERILGSIPPEREKDVILLDPTDEEHSIGFNVLAAHSEFEKNLLASDLVSIFRRLSSSWGDQLNSVLNNAVLAFLESSRGGTLSDLRRFLLDSEFRNEFLQTVRDPDIVYYWRKGFPQLGGNKSVGPVLTRLDTFLGPKPIRYMVSQTANRLDFANILDSGKIFLAKLSQGQIGKENAFLLGSLLVSKFQQLAMSRQRLSVEQRRDFWLYLDEFQNFITPSMAEILAGARKYRIGLVLAHQELHQLQRDSDVASAVMSNPCTRVVFRVGDADAHALEKGFASFEARDLQNLGTGEAICRIERSDCDFNLTIPLPPPTDPSSAAEVRNRVTTASREKYATPRVEIEAALFRIAETEKQPVPAKTKLEKKPEAPAATEARPESVASATTPEPPIPKTPHTKPTPASEVPKVSLPVPDMGIGGAQHQASQKRLKEVAESLGFLATIEKPIPNGSVDLLLERNGQTIACEISVTTTIDHEFRNVTKCLNAGFAQVAVVSTPQRVRQIAEAVATVLGSEEKRVGYYTPDEFIAFLRALPVPAEALAPSQALTESVRRGRKVKVKTLELTAEERRAKEEAHIKLIAEVMRKKA